MACPIIPVTWEAEIRELRISGQMGQPSNVQFFIKRKQKKKNRQVFTHNQTILLAVIYQSIEAKLGGNSGWFHDFIAAQS